MKRVILVDLAGQPGQFRLHEDAYDNLREYLDRARTRLGTEVDATEVLEDLERAICARLVALGAAADRVFAADEIADVLDQVGMVEGATGEGESASASTRPPRHGGSRPGRRRLYRIIQGQQIAGVCNGLSAYADVDVAWVRTIFLAATVVTAGVFLVVYLAMMFILPVAATRADWLATLEAPEQPGLA
jgi:phage shock protein C